MSRRLAERHGEVMKIKLLLVLWAILLQPEPRAVRGSVTDRMVAL